MAGERLFQEKGVSITKGIVREVAPLIAIYELDKKTKDKTSQEILSIRRQREEIEESIRKVLVKTNVISKELIAKEKIITDSKLYASLTEYKFLFNQSKTQRGISLELKEDEEWDKQFKLMKHNIGKILIDIGNLLLYKEKE